MGENNIKYIHIEKLQIISAIYIEKLIFMWYDLFEKLAKED